MLIEIKATALVEENYYMVQMTGYNDETGEEMTVKDIVWFHKETIPGSGEGNKKIGQISFARGHKTLRLSQVPGCRFYGPIMIDSMKLMVTQ